MNSLVFPEINTDPDLPEGVVVMMPPDFPRPPERLPSFLRKAFWQFAFLVLEAAGDRRFVMMKNLGTEPDSDE